MVIVTGWREQSLEISEEVGRITFKPSIPKSSRSHETLNLFSSALMVSRLDRVPVNSLGLSGFTEASSGLISFP